MARGIGWKLTVGCVLLAASVVAFSPVTLNAEPNEPEYAAHGRAERGYLHQAHRADSAAKLPELPSP